jgi:hypothetical protein
VAIKRCPYCKAIIEEGAEFCSNCGTKLLFPDDDMINEEIPGEKVPEVDEPEETSDDFPEEGPEEALLDEVVEDIGEGELDLPEEIEAGEEGSEKKVDIEEDIFGEEEYPPGEPIEIPETEISETEEFEFELKDEEPEEADDEQEPELSGEDDFSFEFKEEESEQAEDADTVIAEKGQEKPEEAVEEPEAEISGTEEFGFEIKTDEEPVETIEEPETEISGTEEFGVDPKGEEDEKEFDPAGEIKDTGELKEWDVDQSVEEEQPVEGSSEPEEDIDSVIAEAESEQPLEEEGEQLEDADTVIAEAEQEQPEEIMEEPEQEISETEEFGFDLKREEDEKEFEPYGEIKDTGELKEWDVDQPVEEEPPVEGEIEQIEDVDNVIAEAESEQPSEEEGEQLDDANAAIEEAEQEQPEEGIEEPETEITDSEEFGFEAKAEEQPDDTIAEPEPEISETEELDGEVKEDEEPKEIDATGEIEKTGEVKDWEIDQPAEGESPIEEDEITIDEEEISAPDDEMEEEVAEKMSPEAKSAYLDNIVDSAEKEKEDIERFLDNLKKERKEKQGSPEEAGDQPSWASQMKEPSSSGIPTEEQVVVETGPSEVADEVQPTELPTEEERPVPSDDRIQDIDDQKGLPFTDYVRVKKKKEGFKFRRKLPTLKLSYWLKSRLIDLFLVAALWLVTLWAASRFTSVSLFQLISNSVFSAVAFLAILLGIYFFLFFFFLGETLGDYLFSKGDE